MTDETRRPRAGDEIRPHELLVASVHDAASLLVARRFADHVLSEVEGDRIRCVTCGHEAPLKDLLGSDAEARGEAEAPATPLPPDTGTAPPPAS